MLHGNHIILKALKRYGFIAHRWLGIAVGLLMAVWALSGIVMMYMPFPELTKEESLHGKTLLSVEEARLRLPPGKAMSAAHIEMMDGAAVLRWSDEEGRHTIQVGDGAAVTEITAGQAMGIARRYLEARGMAGSAKGVELIERDQWTVYGRFHPHRPLYKVEFHTRTSPVLYISSRTGEVVQDTSGTERFWNWFGAVPHWLYYTSLRQHGRIWYRIVVWTSVLGTMLTLTGLYVGLLQFGKGKRGVSPYRGLSLWHHVGGLVFGLVTLTWIVSGLFSMNPWGFFESEGAAAERRSFAGRSLTDADMNRLLERVGGGLPTDIVRLDLEVQDDEPIVIASTRMGERRRYSFDLAPLPLASDELMAMVGRLRPADGILEAGIITRADAYYYAHHDDRAFPVLRVIFDDKDRTRYYLDPVTGELLAKIDRAARQYRFWHHGLHRLDFRYLRARPFWDIVVVPLVAGVTGLCALGAFMGIRRVRRDIRRIRRK